MASRGGHEDALIGTFGPSEDPQQQGTVVREEELR
jgi:hypothetical protein